jgi:RNA polymerase sigma-70 factor (ECF subfamily)
MGPGLVVGKVTFARAGDLEAFEAIVKEHTASVYRLACAVVGPAAAPDVVQETFLAVWQGLPRLRDADRFEAWLHRIAVNQCRSHLRRQGRVREISMSGSPFERDSGPDFHSAVEARAVVAAVFARLSVDHRAVLGLHYAAGLSIRDVALALGIPEGTAKSRLSAALTTLRRSLGEPIDG